MSVRKERSCAKTLIALWIVLLSHGVVGPLALRAAEEVTESDHVTLFQAHQVERSAHATCWNESTAMKNLVLVSRPTISLVSLTHLTLCGYNLSNLPSTVPVQ